MKDIILSKINKIAGRVKELQSRLKSIKNSIQSTEPPKNDDGAN